MKVLSFLFLVCNVVFSVFAVEGNYTTQLGLGVLRFDDGYSTYRGLSINFHVYETGNPSRSKWKGELRFRRFDNEKISLENSRSSVEGVILFRVSGLPDLDDCMRSLKNILHISKGNSFAYDKLAVERESNLSLSNLVTWDLRNILIDPRDVVDTVNQMFTKNGQFLVPKYKAVGYDWDDDIMNCCTFSCRFLKTFGVDLSGCQDLNKWLDSGNGKKGFFGGGAKYLYYTLGFGFARDNVQAGYCIKELYKNKYVNGDNKCLFKKNGINVRPNFEKDRIKTTLGVELK
jgi:hypothetical protein